MFVIAALTIALASPPSAPLRPPDGTYTYTIAAKSGTLTTTIAIESAGATLTVSESAMLPGNKSVLARTSYDAATLLPTHYEVHQRSPLANSDLMASIDRSSIAFNGLALSYTAAPGAKFMLIGEGLAAYRVMMPWTMLVNEPAPFTFAAINGNQTLAGKVVAPSEARPATVAPGDNAIAAQIGDDTVTFWFNPQTHITDEADASSGVSVRLQSYKPQVTKLVEPSGVTHVALAPARYADSEVSVPSSGGTVLSGTLSIPASGAKRHPAIVFVHGSGPGTRDGGTPANATFLFLANSLANSGVAVLRYDKRGIGKSTGTATEDWRPLGDDVRAMVAYLKRRPEVDPRRIFVLGHSEGGLIVPLIANELNVRGIVLMAPPAIPLRDILIEQGFNTMTPAMQKMFTEAFASYDNVDPAKVIATVKPAMLLLQGGKDRQVLASDFPKLVSGAKRAHRTVRAVVFPQDDHLFITLPATQAAQGDELIKPNAQDPRVAAAILQFVASPP